MDKVINQSLFDLSPEQLVLLSSSLTLLLVEGLTPDQQDLLGNFLMSIGQNMQLYSVRAAVLAAAAAADKKDS